MYLSEAEAATRKLAVFNLPDDVKEEQLLEQLWEAGGLLAERVFVCLSPGWSLVPDPDFAMTLGANHPRVGIQTRQGRCLGLLQQTDSHP